MGNALGALGIGPPAQPEREQPETGKNPASVRAAESPGKGCESPTAPVADGPEPAALSKRAQKRLAKEEGRKARKRARRQEEKGAREQKKAERRAERLQALLEHAPEERERILHERLQAMRGVREAERTRRAEVRVAIQSAHSPAACIDLGWNSLMTEKERKSLARQLAYSYSSLRKAVEAGRRPLALSIVGMDGLMGEALTKAASGWEGWPVLVTEEPLEKAHPGRFVYLTHDAEEVLGELEDDCVYVIGGIVDRNRLKGATKEKARRLGVETRRFDLDVVRLSCGTKVLTVNHCVDILLHVVNGMTWKDAFLNVLPERKGLAEAGEADT